jgi:predicted enzyme related to lactoylglutathione lyase
MSEITSLFKSTPYIRVFVKVADGAPLVRSYLENFDAQLEYVFNIPRFNNLQVVGLSSIHGNVSAVITDSLAGFPEYIERTKVLYKVDDIEATLRVAEVAGMRTLQGKTPVPIGFQGRFETPGRYVVELFEISAEGRQYLNPDPARLGFLA